MYDYDIAFIGAGPGGYVGAIRARQLGLKTLVVEKEKAGGVCLNIGCIPSKALIERASMYRSLEELEKCGLKVDRSSFDYGAVQALSRSAADKLSKGIDFLLKKNEVEYVQATARLSGAHEIELEALDGSTKKVTAFATVIATGSRPRLVPGLEFDEKRVLSSTGALMLKALPKKMVILGAGAIGMNFAYIMNAFGVEVSVVEMLDRILPMEDAETASLVRSSFEKRGVQFHTATKAFGLEKKEKGPLSLSIGSADAETASSKLEADLVLVSIGRAPNSADLGLEELGVKLDRGYVEVGDYYESSSSQIFAIGDIVKGEMQLAHVASAQGEIVAERVASLLGKGKGPHEKRIDKRYIPSAVYCEPQVASFGAKEEVLRASNVPFTSASFPFRGVGKAVAIGASEGFVKIFSDPRTGEILGATAVGGEATELIHELLVAAKAELCVEDIANTIHAHPTLSEGVKESALASLGRAIHN